VRKPFAVLVITLGVVVLSGSSAFAHECTNLNKPAGAGAQVVLDTDSNVVSATNGFIHRFEKGLIGPEGEGYHGILGVDLDGDGVADLSTYIVGPEGELPKTAQANGSPDHGIVNLCGGSCG
jgi:hypothetical protein